MHHNGWTVIPRGFSMVSDLVGVGDPFELDGPSQEPRHDSDLDGCGGHPPCNGRFPKLLTTEVEILMGPPEAVSAARDQVSALRLMASACVRGRHVDLLISA